MQQLPIGKLLNSNGLSINLCKPLEKKAKSIYNITVLEKGVSVRTKEKMEV